ncbi:DivIVA domain-containing protein [Tissierella sp. Yu-01]|uniref:DivIVA domain-containing protein n=1 Tax=Tissierella sp. Yu-01 TaxID=3035694 RepID=UPI00240D246A|nr:DivIVA domain-containing protein [Tissierella sp. Yu-01]WFA09828.1 DivIVA domain-containing protein [Tissierella sp. Yu-01]
MITPLDIQNKEFKRTIFGYSAKTVDTFLDEIIIDYERIYKENIELKDKINLLSDQIRQFNTMEDTLKNTLVVAQTTADEVTSSARQKAENIIADAELSGKKLIDQAHEDVRNIKKEYESLKREIYMFKARYQSFLQSQLISMEDFYKNEKDTDTDIVEELDNMGA